MHLKVHKPGLTFMQDNAPSHSVKKVKDRFDETGKPVMNWPPYPSNLNPIVHALAKLKETLYERHPVSRT